MAALAPAAVASVAAAAAATKPHAPAWNEVAHHLEIAARFADTGSVSSLP
jgi:hypothetical protein